MIIPDLNLLVYAFNSSAKEHKLAAKWWEDLLNSGNFVGVHWVVYLGFLRIMTGRHILESPYSSGEIVERVQEWFSIPTVRLLKTSDETRKIIEGLIIKYELVGGMITDAAIVAAAVEHGGTIYSNDTDFLRFEEVRVVNPLK